MTQINKTELVAPSRPNDTTEITRFRLADKGLTVHNEATSLCVEPVAFYHLTHHTGNTHCVYIGVFA